MPDARTLALETLIKCQVDRVPCDALLAPRLARSGLDGRDARFVTNLVRTTHRWQGRADRVLDCRLTKGIRSLDIYTLNILRLAYVQLFHLDQIPPHAAVHTAVDLAMRKQGEGKARLVNQILRGLIARRPTAKEWSRGRGQEGKMGELSHPAWLIERWIRTWGEEETNRICAWNNGVPDLHLRVRGDAGARRRVKERLERDGQRVLPGEVLEEVLRVDGSFPIPDHPLIKDGSTSPQDESQSLVGRLWPAEAGGPILDLCASPGTKSAHLAELHPDLEVIASDLAFRRVRRVADTKRRLHLDRFRVLVADGCRPPFRDIFSRVLLDAPCTGLGVLRRRPDARWLRSPGELVDAARNQKRLLAAAAETVRPGGWLLYSVCSLEPEETETQIAAFLESRSDYRLVALPDRIPEDLTPRSGILRVLPGVRGMEGVFAALMQRAEEKG